MRFLPRMGNLSIILFSLAVSGACALLVEQVSLTFGASPSEMVVSFAANTDETTAECRYGTDPNNLSNTIAATGSKYTMLNYTSPMLFKASMTDLKAGNEVYYYSVGSETLGFSEPNTFKSHPGVGVEDVTFHIFGDIGQTNNSQSTLNELVSYESELTGKSGGIISMGDLSYANGNQPEWDTFGNFVSYASGHIPMMTTMGNHEWFDSPNHEFKAYLARFSNPPVNGERELYYSFDSGLVHWVMIAGYCQNMWTVRAQPCLAQGSPQMDWLTKDLASVDRTVTPWVVAVFHQPYVNSNTKHNIETEGAPMQKAVEEVLNAYNVDLVFSGHVHSYERSCQVYQYNCQAGAPYYITIGDGGNAEGLASTWVEPQPAWSSFRQASYGFGELQVVDSNTMVWRWHQNQDLLPVIADEFTFTKQKKGGLRGNTRDDGASKPVTGKPVFVDNERGRRAAEFNAERSRLYAVEQAAVKAQKES